MGCGFLGWGWGWICYLGRDGWMGDFIEIGWCYIVFGLIVLFVIINWASLLWGNVGACLISFFIYFFVGNVVFNETLLLAFIKFIDFWSYFIVTKSFLPYYFLLLKFICCCWLETWSSFLTIILSWWLFWFTSFLLLITCAGGVLVFPLLLLLVFPLLLLLAIWKGLLLLWLFDL